MREICDLVVERSKREEVLGKVSEAIEPFNVAGLADSTKRNWYPVVLDDLFSAAPKLGATELEIREMLLREQLL